MQRLETQEKRGHMGVRHEDASRHPKAGFTRNALPLHVVEGIKERMEAGENWLVLYRSQDARGGDARAGVVRLPALG
ncbi:hypothetical protein OH797_38380 (plasmid) [Streptomyces anulatus]|uniref:hypothetical protein n=1 Tax=Streptomyces TaxID=1883 RepID=UPI00211D1972|nr:hypothetical protein [Streptomyces sp. or3]